MSEEELPAGYPEQREADVVLSDGRTVHLRPIRPSDAPALAAFHDSLSEQTVYYRFFAPYPHLSARDLERFTQVDYVDRMAFVAFEKGRLVGLGQYEPVKPGTAELAFTVSDDQQGRGLGSVLLEHLALAARDSGLERFVAEVLPDNRRMLGTFVEAGYRPTQHVADGVVSLAFDIHPTPESVAVRAAREHRAESRSIARLLSPGSVAVVGASRRPGSIGHSVLRHLVTGGFTGPVSAVNAYADVGTTIADAPAYRCLADVPAPVDLVVVAVPAQEVGPVVEQAAAVGAAGLVVVSAGFAEEGEAGRRVQDELVATARGSGMRVVGPNAMGVINTDPTVSLNASLAPTLPPRGRTGFFCQSGALGAAILARIGERGLGLSTFVSAGNRADVSGNDLLQFWEDDEATEVVLLYLESIGNPRKFTRIARRLARRKPVVAVRTGRSTQALPLGHRVRRSALPREAVDALFEQSGVIQTETLTEMLDVASLLSNQPLPHGDTVAVVSNSDALAVLAVDAIDAEHLSMAGPVTVLHWDVDPAGLRAALETAIEDPEVGAVLAVHVPPLLTAQVEHIDAILAAAGGSPKPVVAVLSTPGQDRGLAGPSGAGVPVFGSVEEAVRPLAAVARYAAWRARPEELPTEPPRVAEADAILGAVVAGLAATPSLDEVHLRASGGDDDLTRLLGAYGVTLLPSEVVTSASEAVRAAHRFGYPVALTASDPGGERRVDGIGVRLDLYDERAVRGAWKALHGESGADEHQQFVIQPMAERGVDCCVATAEDPSFGPVVSLIVGGSVPVLLRDRAFRIPPLTGSDARALVDSPRIAPLLGRVPDEVLGELEELLVRLGRLAEESPALAELTLDPVLLTPHGLVVLGARACVRRPGTRVDDDARKLWSA